MYGDGLRKILIVEDDLTYRGPLSNYLAARAYTVSTADNGEQALEKLLFYKPQLVVLDLLMPKVDGFEVLKRIRSYPDAEVAKTPILILSNLFTDKDIEKAQTYQIDGYLIKAQTSMEQVYQKAQDIIYKGNPPPEGQMFDFAHLS